MESLKPENAPLLDWLLSKHPETPRNRAKQWILAGRVSVAGVVIRRPHQSMGDPGDQLELLGKNRTALDCGPGLQIHPRVELLYLDPALAIVNKGAGLIAVPAPNCELSALSILADFLVGKIKPRDRDAARKALPAAYRRLECLPVHRLDQYTSGAFCIACNPSAREHLIDQLKARTMGREYVAFVEGRPKATQGTWHNWLQLSEDQLRQYVVPEARAKTAQAEGKEVREAITNYELLNEYRIAGGMSVSKLRLKLESGRKHQIRAQAANAGHPLVGDRTYNPRYGRAAAGAPAIEFPRQALHAEILSLEHPNQAGKRMSWKADLPKDLKQLEATLRMGRAGYAPERKSAREPDAEAQ
jgi:23S rRNA pseudouridine1911/1915/1917 synthase